MEEVNHGGDCRGSSYRGFICGKPVYLVVLLHGHDSDGQTLINHALNWAPTMPKAEFLAAELAWPRWRTFSRQWFDMADTSPAKMIKGVKTVAPLLDIFSTKCLPNAASRSHLALVGFRKARCSHYMWGSGANANGSDRGVFCAVFDSESSRPKIRSKPPVLLIHGELIPSCPLLR